jgi:hypothetical protein
MDKILAFSILSSSPADLAAGGGYYSTRLSWRTVSVANQKRRQAERAPKQEKGEELPVPEKEKQHQQQEATRARFAPEFDGLNCFESIVSA